MQTSLVYVSMKKDGVSKVITIVNPVHSFRIGKLDPRSIIINAIWCSVLNVYQKIGFTNSPNFSDFPLSTLKQAEF